MICLACLVWAPSLRAAEEADLASSQKAGLELATELRDLQPLENSAVRGLLKIRAGKTRVDVPVVCVIATNTNSWSVSYEVAPGTNAAVSAEKLVVEHQPGQPNRYHYARASAPGQPLPELKLLASAEAQRPLAGSDFWLSDLGLDFLHWPDQRLLPADSRLGRDCRVLESRCAGPAGVVRVKSWVDEETGGILVAEGYDAHDAKVKEFTLSGSSFKKVNGRWQLQEMKMLSPQADSLTMLKFDLSVKAGKP